MTHHPWHHSQVGYDMEKYGVGHRFPLERYKISQMLNRHWRGMFWTGIESLTRGWRPYTVSLTPGIYCPNRCHCCPWDIYRDSCNRNNLSMMTIDTFQKILKNTPMMYVVEWCGFCECFTNPLTPDFIALGWKSKRRMQLSSTLVGLTKDGAKKIDGVKFEKVIIHCPDSVNFITNEDKWISNWLHSLDGINIGFVTFQSLGPISDKIYNAVSKYGLYQTIPGIEGRADAYTVPRNVTGSIECHSYCKGGNYLFVRPNGDLHYCPNDWNYEFVMGNLAEQPLREITQGKKFKDYERSMNSQNDPILCRRCFYAVTKNNPWKVNA